MCLKFYSCGAVAEYSSQVEPRNMRYNSVNPASYPFLKCLINNIVQIQIKMWNKDLITFNLGFNLMPPIMQQMEVYLIWKTHTEHNHDGDDLQHHFFSVDIVFLVCYWVALPLNNKIEFSTRKLDPTVADFLF